MRKLKDIVKQDFESKLPQGLKAPTLPKEEEVRVQKKKAIDWSKFTRFGSLAAAAVLTLAIGLPIAKASFGAGSSIDGNTSNGGPINGNLNIDWSKPFVIKDEYNAKTLSEHVQPYEKTYTKHELKMIESASFKALNSVNYPAQQIDPAKFSNSHYDDYQWRTTYVVDREFTQAVQAFAMNAYTHAQVSEENFSFSPLGLYANMNVLSAMTSDKKSTEVFDSVLGLDYATRAKNYRNAYVWDYFVNSAGTMQMYNALFAADQMGRVNQDMVEKLSELYTEVYKLDVFKDSDVGQMLDWIDNKMGEKNFFPKDELEINKETAFFAVSTLFMQNSWYSEFKKENCIQGNFHTDKGTITTDFMNHSIAGFPYEYDKYISCYDYYNNGMKVKYILPKDGVTLAELAKENFLTDNYANRLKAADCIINLTVPKFETENLLNLTDMLKGMGLEHVTKRSTPAFNGFFPDSEYNVYLSFTKQRNKVSFGEDGTTIKSVTVSGGDKATAAPNEPIKFLTVDITLNRPFIYVIYDANNLPVYIGNMQNPKA